MDFDDDHFDDATGAFCSMLPDPDDDRENVIAELEHRLVHAGESHDLALNLDLVLLTLEREALGRAASQLAVNERNRLLAALSKATARAFAAPPRGFDRRQTVAGIMVIVQTIEFWSLPDAARMSRRQLCGHLRALMRVFRNGLHSACLLNDLVDDLEVITPWHDLCGVVPPDLDQAQHLLSHPVAAIYTFISAYSSVGEK